MALGVTPLPTQPVNPQAQPAVGLPSPTMATAAPVAQGPVAPATFGAFQGVQPGQRKIAGMTDEQAALYDYNNAKRKWEAGQKYAAQNASLQSNLANAYTDKANRELLAQQSIDNNAAAAAGTAKALQEMGAAQQATHMANLQDIGGATREEQVAASAANRVGQAPAPQARPSMAAPPKMSKAQFQQLQQRNPQQAQAYQQQVMNYQRSMSQAPRAQGPQQPQQSSGPDWGSMALGLGGKALGVPSGLTSFLGKLF